MKILNVPPVLDDDGVLSLLRDLNQNINIPEVSINFKTLEWVRPFGTLVFAEGLKDFIKKRKENNLHTYYLDIDWLKKKSSGPISYLKYFGFFQYCGMRCGDFPNRGHHTNRYFPITIITKEHLENESFLGNWRNSIERKCEELAQLVTMDYIAHDYLEYSFREIIRNVFEHSRTESCSIMAQCYSDDEIEIAVADRGVGIHKTLVDKFKTNDPLESLFIALEPGVSCVDIERSKGQWGNSGFGLYILSGVGKEYGTFSILSSGAYLSLYKEDKKTVVDSLYYAGTAVKITVKKALLEYFPNLKKNLIDAGEVKYFDKYGKKIKASGKSKSS